MKKNTGYYDVDSFFTEEQSLIRNAARAWVIRSIKLIFGSHASSTHCNFKIVDDKIIMNGVNCG